jgi:hypothetical protein
MANRIINPDSIPYLEKFFDDHKLFYVTDFPWQIFNVESNNAFSTINNTSTRLGESVWNPNENKKLRYKWMCEEYGFFNVIRNERNSFFRILEYALNKDNPYTLRQRRYLTQQLIEFSGVTNNPIHFSVKPNVDNAILDLDDYKSCRDFELICHPGATRAAAHTFLRSNGKKLFLYINKKYFSKMEFKYSGGVEEIKHWDGLVNYFEPNFDKDVDLIYNFTNASFDDSTYKNNMKYHRQTECNVLKLFEMKPGVATVTLKEMQTVKSNNRFLKTETFQSDAFFDSYNISKILTNSVLNVYSNNPKPGELWAFLCRNRNNFLDHNFKDRYDVYSTIDLHNISQYMTFHRPQFQDKIDSNLYNKILKFFMEIDGTVLENNLIDECRFDYDDKYIEIENDFKKIVKENDYKGYAIWIDKDVLLKMDREIYEFLYIVRNDIAITKTKNDKVAIINCEHEDWKMNKLNSKSIWIIEDSFACKEEE